MSNYVRMLTHTAIFLLPAAANLLEHGSSILYSLLVLFGILAWINRRTRLAVDKWEKLFMAAFVGYFLFCLIAHLLGGLFSPGADFSWNLGHELRFLGFLPIYYLLRSGNGLKDWPIWYGATAGAISSAVYALWHVWIVQSGMRVVGAYNPIVFGDLSLVYGFVSLAGIRYFTGRHPLLLILPVTGFLGGLLAAFLSGTLGAVLAIPLLALLFIVYLREFSRPWLWRITATVVIACALGGYYQMSSAPIKERFHTEFKQARLFFSGRYDQLSGEDAYRLRVWTAAWRIYQNHPLAGVGKKGYRQEIRRQTGIDASHLHNMYLEYLVNYGIFGLLLFPVLLLPFVWFAKTALYGRSRKGKDLAYAGMSLTGGYIVFSITECLFYRNVFISVYLVCLAGMLVLIRKAEEDPTGLAA